MVFTADSEQINERFIGYRWPPRPRIPFRLFLFFRFPWHCFLFVGCLLAVDVLAASLSKASTWSSLPHSSGLLLTLSFALAKEGKNVSGV